MLKYANSNFNTSTIPIGYGRILWCNTKIGQTVYLNGTYCGEPKPYGPHFVIDKDQKTLRNTNGRKFPYMCEELIIPLV